MIDWVVMDWVLTVMSILGTWLNIQKKASCWIIWSIANIGWVISFLLKGMMAQASLFMVYLILSIYGWIKWQNNTESEQKY